MRSYVRRDARRDPERCKGHPAREHDVDEDQDFLERGVNEDVSGDVCLAFVGELEGLVPEVEGVGRGEGDGGEGTVGVRDGEEVALGEGVGDDGGVGEEGGCADVVGVVVAVDEVGDGEGGGVVDCPEEFVADCWGGVDEDDAFGGDEEECCGWLAWWVGSGYLA